jgi:hypothetical protein
MHEIGRALKDTLTVMFDSVTGIVVLIGTFVYVVAVVLVIPTIRRGG